MILKDWLKIDYDGIRCADFPLKEPSFGKKIFNFSYETTYGIKYDKFNHRIAWTGRTSGTL